MLEKELKMQSATANSRSLFLYPYLYRDLKRDASLTRKYTRATMHSHRNNDPAIIPEMTNGTQDERSETNNHRLFFHKVLAYIAFPIAAIFFLLKRERSADFTPAPPLPRSPASAIWATSFGNTCSPRARKRRISRKGMRISYL